MRVAVEQRVGTGASEKMTRSFLDKETGLPVYEQDSNGGETVFEYDEYHRLIKTIYPDGKEKTIEISDDLKTKTVESNGLTVKTKIDSLGRTLWIDNPEGLEDVAYTYTDLDRVSKVEKGILIGDTLSQSRIVEEFRYDTKGRVIEKILPDWGTTSIYFDDNLNKQTTTDFAGRVSVKEYDDLNRLVKETINGVTKTYEIDSLNSMSYVKDGRGLYHINEGHSGWEQTSYHSTTTLSNKIPKKQTLFKANGLVETSVISGRDGVSNTYTFDYDSLGRVSEIFQNDVSKESYNYGESNHGKSIGRLTKSENNDLTQSYTYDLTGRVTHEETTVKGAQQIISLDRGYNPKGKRDSTTYRDGKKLTYTYDSLNRIKTISYEQTLIATYTYNLKGTVTDITYGNGVKNSYTYEKDVLVTEMKTTNPISEKEIKETYSYDNRGRLIEKTYPQLIKGTTKTRTYEYTNRDKLKTVKEGGTSLYEYTYDNNGNMLTLSQPTPEGIQSATLIIDPESDRLTQKTQGQKETTYGYDIEGNLNQKTNSGKATNLSYNWQSQLKTYEETTGDKLTANYIYNNNRERVYSKTKIKERGSSDVSEEKEIYYIWDNGQCIGEQDKEGNITVRYIYSGNEKLAMVRTDDEDTERISYFINNPQGTPSIIVDQEGNIEHSQELGPWGNLEEGVFGSKNEVNYTGKKKDRATGLFYFNQRYYDPDIYRFIQEDPAEQFLNPYVYAANNPMMYVDPDGQWIESAAQILGNIIGGGLKPAIYNVAGQFNNNWGRVDWGEAERVFWGGAVSSAAFQVVHVVIPDYGIAKISAHALVGGYFSTQNGGTFLSGAMIGGLNQAVAPLIDQIDVGSSQSIVRVGASAAFGSGLAAITGDDVLNGALIAAYSRAYNDELYFRAVAAKANRVFDEKLLFMRGSVENIQKNTHWGGELTYGAATAGIGTDGKSVGVELNGGVGAGFYVHYIPGGSYNAASITTFGANRHLGVRYIRTSDGRNGFGMAFGGGVDIGDLVNPFIPSQVFSHSF